MKKLINFVRFVRDLAKDNDVASLKTSQSTHGRRDDRLLRLLLDLEGPLKQFSFYSQMLLEMALSRAVDNFMAYLAELLGIVFRTRPETMRSNGQVSLEMVLSYETRAELIDGLAEYRVNNESYKGLRDLNKFFKERLNLPLFPDDETLKRAIRINEDRNVIVHNRGDINSRYVEHVPSATRRLDQRVDVSIKSLASDLAFLTDAVNDIDSRARHKFNLPTSRYRAPASTE